MEIEYLSINGLMMPMTPTTMMAAKTIRTSRRYGRNAAATRRTVRISVFFGGSSGRFSIRL
jgi:hypothetical protein